MATNWAVFPSGFSVTFDHDNEPTEEELKEKFIKKLGAYLKGDFEFTLEASDPQKIYGRKAKEIRWD